MAIPSDPIYLLIYVVIIIVILAILVHVVFHFIAIGPIGYTQDTQQLMQYFKVLLPLV